MLELRKGLLRGPFLMLMHFARILLAFCLRMSYVSFKPKRATPSQLNRMTYFITPGQNRYYLNAEQRQLLIASEREVLLLDDWCPKEVSERESWLKELSNKELVEMICGCQWEGFVGQTLKMA